MVFQKGHPLFGDGRPKHWMEVPKEQWPDDLLNVHAVYMHRRGHLLVKRGVTTEYRGEWYIYHTDGTTIIAAKPIHWREKNLPSKWANKQVMVYEEILLRKNKGMV